VDLEMSDSKGKDPYGSCGWIVDKIKNFFDWGVRIMGPVMVLLATALITAVIVAYFHVILPLYATEEGIPWKMMCHVVLSLFLSGYIAFNYFMVVFTPPGFVIASQEGSTEEAAEPKRGEGFSRYCKICKMAKPERTHHCHVCKRCVLKMDHHCPWVSNCVGSLNHKYFVLFLLYLWLGCAYVAIMSFSPFQDFSSFKLRNSSTRGIVIFSFVITLSVTLALSFMLSWQLYLALSGQTTIEFYFNQFKGRQSKTRGQKWENPYDLGVRKNFQLFFGSGQYWFSWLLPSLSTARDGSAFAVRDEIA